MERLSSLWLPQACYAGSRSAALQGCHGRQVDEQGRIPFPAQMAICHQGGAGRPRPGRASPRMYASIGRPPAAGSSGRTRSSLPGPGSRSPGSPDVRLGERGRGAHGSPPWPALRPAQLVRGRRTGGSSAACRPAARRQRRAVGRPVELCRTNCTARSAGWPWSIRCRRRIPPLERSNAEAFTLQQLQTVSVLAQREPMALTVEPAQAPMR